jgi:hypothetical protein
MQAGGPRLNAACAAPTNLTEDRNLLLNGQPTAKKTERIHFQPFLSPSLIARKWSTDIG